MASTAIGTKLRLSPVQLQRKRELLSHPVRQLRIEDIPDVRGFVDNLSEMSFSARDLARAAKIYVRMLQDPDCTIGLCLAGSSGAAGCLDIYAALIMHNMVDFVVATGASIVDMDFFEAFGNRHYHGSPDLDNAELRELGIDRIYDTLIDEEALAECDSIIARIAREAPDVCSSRRFIGDMGKYLLHSADHAKKPASLVQLAFEFNVPVFCPAFNDCSAGLGLVMYRRHNSEHRRVIIDSIADFDELTEIKIKAGPTGLFMVGGGVPKNFAQDMVVCAQELGFEKTEMHKYAIQVTVADVRDGALSSSTLKEAHSWGKVDTANEQMVFAEATLAIPLICGYAFQMGDWEKSRPRRRLAKVAHSFAMQYMK